MLLHKPSARQYVLLQVVTTHPTLELLSVCYCLAGKGAVIYKMLAFVYLYLKIPNYCKRVVLSDPTQVGLICAGRSGMLPNGEWRVGWS